MGALCRYSSESSNQYACMYLKIGCCRSVLSEEEGRQLVGNGRFYVYVRSHQLAESNCVLGCRIHCHMLAFQHLLFPIYCPIFSHIPYSCSAQSFPPPSRTAHTAATPPVSGPNFANMSTTPTDTEILNPADEEFYASYVSSYS